MSKVHSLKACVVVMLLLAGCSAPFPPAADGLPPDFGLEFSVHGDLHSRDPFVRSARYVLLPSRQFRALLGSTSEIRTYPRLVRVVSPEEFATVYHAVHDRGLEKSGADPKPEAKIAYDILIVANGEHYRLTTTPEQLPAAKELLGRLLELGRNSDYFDNEADPFPVAPPRAPK